MEADAVVAWALREVLGGGVDGRCLGGGGGEWMGACLCAWGSNVLINRDMHV